MKEETKTTPKQTPQTNTANKHRKQTPQTNTANRSFSSFQNTLFSNKVKDRGPLFSKLMKKKK